MMWPGWKGWKRMIPTPGSDEAIEQGCKCPVLDNHHGRGMPYESGPRFWINGDCPIHKTWSVEGREPGE